jgi:signal transduction histidine kinase
VNGYLLIPLFAGTASIVLAVAILMQDPSARLNRRSALLVGGAAFWALCEVLFYTASDPVAAMRVIRVSALGWLALGPLGLDVLLGVSGRPAPRERRALPYLYAVSAAFLPVVLGGWMHPRVVPTAWGWGYELGPIYALFYVFTAGSLVVGLRSAAAALRASASPAERAQLRWVATGVFVPLVVASTTDGILPFFGVQVVHLATASFAFLGATIAWSFHRYGYSLLAPSAFAREILDTIPDGVALLTLDGRVRTANPAMARLLGRGAAELAGLDLQARLPRALESPDGAVRECELGTLGDGAVPVSAASRVLLDRQGLPFGRVIVLRDMREVTELRRRLVTAGRLAAVGELAAGIAHEINNPIAFVRANLHTLRDYWTELRKQAGAEGPTAELLQDGEELIDECLEGTERVRTIVQDVKGFAHVGDERTLVDVNALLEAALRVARPQLPRDATIECVYSDLPPVLASARHLQQVFLNLLTNAGDAIGERGTIRLQTSRAAGGALVRVVDDGCGIPPEALERVFDPFFTTKGVGRGTGLGLAICYQIVRSHGGDIRIESAPGEGTRVEVLLCAEPAGDAADPSASAGDLAQTASASDR